MTDPVELFEAAASGAATMIGKVTPEQRHLPTPCTEWNVSDVIEHLGGGTAYLLGALGIEPGPPPSDEATYRAAVAACVAGLRQPGALDLRCPSPAGFEWSVAEAAAGTFMDQLIHTWDLATAIGADTTLDPQLVEACVAIFLPHMPEVGRQAGIVGPEVAVPDGAAAQDQLLGAMGRQP